MNRYTIIIASILFIVSGLFSCEQKKTVSEDPNTTSAKDHTFSDSIVQNIRGKENTFIIEASKAQSLITVRGIRLSIPENAFITEEGTAPIGKITLRLSEYHNPAEILVSDIPMTYNTPSGNIQLESAGMFNIRASSEGKRLRLANGKEIQIQVPSANPDSNFNLYNFDTDRNQWIEVQQQLQVAPIDMPAEPNKKRSQSKLSGIMTIEWAFGKAEERMVNGKLIKLVKPDCIGSEDSTYQLPVRLTDFPEIGVYQEPQWICMYDADSEQLSQTFATDSLLSASIVERVTPFNKYLISFTFRASTFRLYMKVASKENLCIINEERYTALLEQRTFNEQKVEALHKKRKKEAKEADLYRSFSINKLGIWNCDRLYLMTKKTILHATFRNILTKEQIIPSKIYLIDQSINSVWTYSAGTITLNPDANNILVFVNSAGNMCFARINRLSDSRNEQELSLIIDVQEFANNPENTDELNTILQDV